MAPLVSGTPDATGAHEARSADELAHTWAMFSALERTLGPTPGAIDEWRRGRRRYAVWVIRLAVPAVMARMAAVAERLAGKLVPVAPEDAHVTLWVCGFPAALPTLDDDVAETTLAAQAAAVAAAAPPRLVLGRPNAFASCAFLEVVDAHGDLAALRAKLALPGAREVRFARYQPHVTVGRFNDAWPTAPIAAQLAGLRCDPRFSPLSLTGSVPERVELDAAAPARLTTVWPPSSRCDSPA